MPSATARSPLAGPAFLRGLDHVIPCPCCEGWMSRCPVFGCLEWLHIEPGLDGHWAFHCAVELEAPVHTHDEVVAYLQCDTRLDPIAATRSWRALVLSPRLEVWAALLSGQHVPVSALDPLWARRFGLR